ncbi:anhydro-N-acetylmuramic acid kinase [Trichoderma gamsii]|uniref:Anhydro-N-acetylmuramic acid kinase n=1 Tax=Trichoderma gamsii TaxID=398673 RepID=A0A2P4ZSK2_9HYPO|nr:anhydro-N-acetylmuramic acid kinase [Trichoderma gamsii]PON27276.1 anhydro-N-acetylmuramic acid kinase [Trichoderma gamsii]
MTISQTQQNGNRSVTNGQPHESHSNSYNGNGHHRSSNTGALDLTVLGMNSGTAMDGIDCALVRYYQQTPDDALHMELIKYDEIPVPQWIKKPVLTMLRETKTTPSKMSQLNMDSIDLIGSHGQTIWLLSMPEEGETRSAFCLGEGTVISAITGITTVTDFRMAEQAVGRQGAPLVALIDGLLLHHPTKWRVCQNIGGIANLCVIPPDSEGGVDSMVDWDCGPGNMFIDNAMRYFTNGEMEYDKDGEWSSRGNVRQDIVDKFLSTNMYCNHVPPKTTGRETFGDNEGQEIIDECLAAGCNKYDTLATITRITAQNIIKQYRTFFPRFGISVDKIAEVYMCGGGARNPSIIKYLREQLPDTKIRALDETGVPSDAKEAVSFAQQAMEAILGRPALVPINSDNLLPNTISGKIAPGRRWREVMKSSIKFGEGRSTLPTVKEMIVQRPYTSWKAMQAFD